MKQYRLLHKKEIAQYQHKWYVTNRNQILAKNKEWRRMHCIDYGRSREKRLITGLNKRLYPKGSKCELCSRECNNKLKYHHWDDTNLNKGIWICHVCHSFAERVDDGVVDIYFRKKDMVERDCQLSISTTSEEKDEKFIPLRKYVDKINEETRKNTCCGN